MKKKQIAVLQIVSVFVICILVLLTVLYQKGYYDFTFIDRPSDESDNESTTKYNVLDIFTPTFEFGEQTKGESIPQTTSPNLTTSDNVQSEPEQSETLVEGGESEEDTQETLPPLDFETEPEESETSGENSDETTGVTGETTDGAGETTDSPEQTTGEPENTDAPEATDTPDNTTGPDESTDVPSESETTATPEQTTAVNSETT